MPLPHANPGEIIDITPFGPAYPHVKTTVLVKTDTFQIVRLVIPAGKDIPRHQAQGEITVQCLEGRVVFTTENATHTLEHGQMLYLAAKVFHSLHAIEDASVLVTIALR